VPGVRFRWTVEIFSARLWARVSDAFGTLRLVAGRGLVLALQSHEGQGGEEPNRAPGVRFRWTAEIFSAVLWAQSSDAFGTSRLAAGRGLVLALQSHEGRGGEEPNRAPRVPLDGRPRSSRQYCIALFTVGAFHT
jgi:hypothetical protein